jgi:antitoxin PrlF
MATARITSKGQITVPKEIREHLGVQPGDSLEFHFANGQLEVRPVRRRRLTEFRGLFRMEQAFDFTEERARAWAGGTQRLVGGGDPSQA